MPECMVLFFLLLFLLNHYAPISQANWCNMTFTAGNLNTCIGWSESILHQDLNPGLHAWEADDLPTQLSLPPNVWFNVGCGWSMWSLTVNWGHPTMCSVQNQGNQQLIAFSWCSQLVNIRFTAWGGLYRSYLFFNKGSTLQFGHGGCMLPYNYGSLEKHSTWNCMSGIN